VRLQIGWVCVVLATFVVACDSRSGSKADGSAASSSRDLPKPVFGTGTIRGKVLFAGKPPERKDIPNVPCHDGAPPLKEETVVVNDNGTLANVFVSLSGVPASDGSDRSPVLLDQVNCRYVPHAVGVQVNQVLRVKSSDEKTLHNVHYTPAANPPANFGLTQAGAEKPVTFTRPEYVRVKCDVHPWMTGYVGVFDHPFFAVTSEGTGDGGAGDGGTRNGGTGDAGSFEIAKVPAGSYKLVAWHEQYGEVEQQVEVKDNQVSDVTVTYKAP
jgi:hypothetical protein